MDDGGKHKQIDVPDSVRFILDTLRNSGFEAFIVGGCVRDRLLGREPEDWDITTSALPFEVKDLFHATIDTGIAHGTVMVIRGGKGYEVTTYRVDGEYKDGRHPESVRFTPSLEEDLKRRDFTINAFAYDPDCGIVDLFGGLKDLSDGMVRAVGDPRKRFDEDALRIMRAVRFSAQLSFDIEQETKDAISEFAPRLKLVSRERIRVEFEKTLFSDNPAYVNKYAALGLAEYIVPDFHEKCFRDESVPLYERITDRHSNRGKILSLAAFFRLLSAEECANVMRRMTFDNRSRDLVSGILKYRGGSSETQGGLPDNESDIRRMLNKTGTELFELIMEFDSALGADTNTQREKYNRIIMQGDAFAVSMLDINGEDLLAEGIPAGKEIGITLNRLLDMVIEDPKLNKKEILIKLVRSTK